PPAGRPASSEARPPGRREAAHCDCHVRGFRRVVGGRDGGCRDLRRSGEEARPRGQGACPGALPRRASGGLLRDRGRRAGSPGSNPVTLLEVSDLSVRFATEDGPVHAVDRLSFAIERGEVLGIVGESGCGKTVACLSLVRLLPESATVTGRVLLDGVD